jgi:multidrug efflux pump subunit AcrA (membrane-fusion protein)
MSRSRSRRLLWLVLAGIGLTTAAVGLWYSHRRGWLEPVYGRVRALVGREDTSETGTAGMPGMAMGGMAMGQAGEASSVPGRAVVLLLPNVRQRIGVTIGTVEEAPLRMNIRTVGIVQPDETKVAHVHLKTEGWVKEVSVNYTGQKIKKGQPLLSIYSPQFVATQQEYLNAHHGKQAALAQLARQRLEL